MMAAVAARGTHAARFRAACVALLVTVTACTPQDGSPDPAAATPTAARATGVMATGVMATGVVASDAVVRARPGYVIDSIRPVDEELRRFRAGLPPVHAFTGGAGSREALVRRFIARLQDRDPAALRALALSPEEFAYLVYPASSYTRPPYRTAPGFVWMQLAHNGETGLRRLLREDFVVAEYHGHTCDEDPVPDGNVVLWRACRVDVTLADRRRVRARLFGVIVEHQGRFKFANYHTDF